MSLSLDRINISHKGEDDIQSIDNNFQAIENEINSHLADYANLLSSFNGLFNNVPNISNSNLDNSQQVLHTAVVTTQTNLHLGV